MCVLPVLAAGPHSDLAALAQSYGPEHLLTFHNLKRIGLLTEQSPGETLTAVESKVSKLVTDRAAGEPGRGSWCCRQGRGLCSGLAASTAILQSTQLCTSLPARLCDPDRASYAVSPWHIFQERSQMPLILWPGRVISEP